ncbi:MAG: NUDIX domain-containing protein [Chloroflexi bacterium]|nr:NUDIX domain-containing protein [Chloroflexota bacterium]
MRTRDEVSAGGVVFRVREDGGFDVALIRTHEQRWQLPKGWIEAGESDEAAAVREVREETGLESDVVGRLDTIEYWYRSTYEPEPARVHKFVHFFLLRAAGGSTEAHDDEVLEARWTDIDEAGRLLAFKDERQVMAQALALLREAARSV